MILQRKPRPAFHAWRVEHNLTVRATADLLETAAGYRICSHEKVRTVCLPFGDAERTEPDPELLAAIATLTNGEIRAADFEPPSDLRPSQAAAA